MYKIKFILIIILSVANVVNSQSYETEFSAIEWAIKMADSDQNRNPNPVFLDHTKQPKWNYTHGLVTLANQKLYHATKNSKYWNYALEYANQMIDKKGNILGGYSVNRYSLDLINPGKILFDIYAQTRDLQYKNAIDTLYKQLKSHPRNLDGGYWHKKNYPWQMWLDGVYMADPFSAQYGAVFNESSAVNDAIQQVELIQKHTFNKETGLNYHGYDEKREQFWANKSTGCSSHVWGRAQGWYCMALVDILDYVPKTHPKYSWMVKNLQQVFNAVLKSQDIQTGVWKQVMDQPKRDGNYFESSASVMFIYAFAKAYNNGYVDRKFLKAANKGFQGVINQFIVKNPDGSITISKCCAVAGLGGKNPEDRDGSYSYYLSEPIRDNDAKAVGPFILAAIELHKSESRK